MTASSGHTMASAAHGSVVRGVGQFGDQRARVAELDAGADAEAVGQPLAEPALHALGGHQHQFGGERVGQRLREQCAQTVGELIRPLRAVQVQGHRRSA